ncbi:MAG: hypothetical protein R3E79_22095 [Caldilineaceae bacterium]
MQQNFDTYLNKALREAKLQDLRASYESWGYRVDQKLQNQYPGFDLILKNPAAAKTIAFEVEVFPVVESKLQDIAQLQKEAQALGIDFRLVTIARPRGPYIEIDWFKAALIDYIQTEAAAQFVNASGFTHIGDLAYTITDFVVNGVHANLKINGEVVFISGPTDDLERYIALFGEESFQFQGCFVLDLGQKRIVQGDISTAVYA